MQLSNSNGQTSDLYQNQKHLQYTYIYPCISLSRHCYGKEKGLERQAQGCWSRSICIAKRPSLCAKDWQPTATPISRERAGKTRTRWLVKVDLQRQTVLTLCRILAAYNINTMKKGWKANHKVAGQGSLALPNSHCWVQHKCHDSCVVACMSHMRAVAASLVFVFNVQQSSLQIWNGDNSLTSHSFKPASLCFKLHSLSE